MPDPSKEFREQLLRLQAINPLLRDAYQRELDDLLYPPMSLRTAWPGTALLVMLLVCAGLIVRAAFVNPVGPLMLGAYAMLVVAFLWASVLIVRDLHKRKHSRRSAFSIANLLTGASGTITVIALILGAGAASDPKTLFGAFYVFVFYFACSIWSLQSRIEAAELSAREQLLRIECRLADLAKHLPP